MPDKKALSQFGNGDDLRVCKLGAGIGPGGDILDILRWNIVNEKLEHLGRECRIAFIRKERAP